MKIEPTHSDAAVLAELGERLARRRIDLNLTQADLATRAGVSKRTVERIEAGKSTQLTSLIRLLRVLDLIGSLDLVVPDTGPSPMDLLKLKGKERKRAGSRRRARNREPWTWGDEP